MCSPAVSICRTRNQNKQVFRSNWSIASRHWIEARKPKNIASRRWHAKFSQSKLVPQIWPHIWYRSSVAKLRRKVAPCAGVFPGATQKHWKNSLFSFKNDCGREISKPALDSDDFGRICAEKWPPSVEALRVSASRKAELVHASWFTFWVNWSWD